MMKTKFVGAHPFGALAPKSLTIDVARLKIESTPYQPEGRRSIASKYTRLFSKLSEGQCIVCEPKETGSVRAALQKHYKNRKAHPIIRTISHCEDGKGRVWLVKLEKLNEVPNVPRLVAG
jgi:hypothetical protein